MNPLQQSEGQPTLHGIVGEVYLNGHAESDARMVAELHAMSRPNQWTYAPGADMFFSNQDLATNWASTERSLTDRIALMHHLHDDMGTTRIDVKDDLEVIIDEEVRPLTLVSATETTANHGDMSRKFYLRDQVQTAAAYMELFLQDNERFAEEGNIGRELLISSLDYMSTADQEDRFERVIQTGEDDQEQWPHILSEYGDISSEGPNGWRNRQDSFQMLAHLTFDAIGRDFIGTQHLTDANKRFLGSVVPFLAKVGFPEYESSGTWEEVPTNRTSVMTVETATMIRLQEIIADGHDMSFITDRFDQLKADVPAIADEDFDASLDHMIDDGLQAIGRRLPFESPDDHYEDNPVKYREADMAAIMYLLKYDMPRILAGKHIEIGKAGSILTEEQIETLVLDQAFSLFDHETNGMGRYVEDAYQGNNFNVQSILIAINALKQKIIDEAEAEKRPVDYESKQFRRSQIVPKGGPAAWNLGLLYLGSWAEKRSLRYLAEGDTENADKYDDLGTFFLNCGLSHITGEGQHHISLGEDTRYRIAQVPPNRMPESINTYSYYDGDGRFISFKAHSPHVPLNWSSAILRQTVGLQVVYASKRAAKVAVGV